MECFLITWATSSSFEGYRDDITRHTPYYIANNRISSKREESGDNRCNPRRNHQITHQEPRRNDILDNGPADVAHRIKYIVASYVLIPGTY